LWGGKLDRELSVADVSEQRAVLDPQFVSELQYAEESHGLRLGGVANLRDASLTANSIAARMLDGSAFPVPAMSRAVP
jgi:hypothetical protein